MEYEPVIGQLPFFTGNWPFQLDPLPLTHVKQNIKFDIVKLH